MLICNIQGYKTNHHASRFFKCSFRKINHLTSSVQFSGVSYGVHSLQDGVDEDDSGVATMIVISDAPRYPTILLVQSTVQNNTQEYVPEPYSESYGMPTLNLRRDIPISTISFFSLVPGSSPKLIPTP